MGHATGGRTVIAGIYAVETHGARGVVGRECDPNVGGGEMGLLSRRTGLRRTETRSAKHVERVMQVVTEDQAKCDDEVSKRSQILHSTGNCHNECRLLDVEQPNNASVITSLARFVRK